MDAAKRKAHVMHIILHTKAGSASCILSSPEAALSHTGLHERHAAQRAQRRGRVQQQLAVAVRAHAVAAYEQHPQRIDLNLLPTHLHMPGCAISLTLLYRR